MQVREASVDDRSSWNAFVDKESGSFFQYFDWKYVYETRGLQYIPLMITNRHSQIIGILPTVKEKEFMWSSLRSTNTGRLEVGGLLLKKSLTPTECDAAVEALLEHINNQIAHGCSSIRIVESDTVPNSHPNPRFLDHGYRYCYSDATGLPGNFVLELEQPFAEKIWKSLWPKTLKQEINKAVRSGAVVVEDSEFQHASDFSRMLIENCQRHGAELPSMGEITTRLNLFKDKSKLFIASKENKPMVGLLCHYTRSTCYLSLIGSWTKDCDDVNKLCVKVAIEDACDAGYRYVDFGCSYEAGLAFYKERFRATRYPIKLYEKIFSLPKYAIDVSPRLIRNVWANNRYLYDHRAKIWTILNVSLTVKRTGLK